MESARSFAKTATVQKLEHTPPHALTHTTAPERLKTNATKPFLSLQNAHSRSHTSFIVPLVNTLCPSHATGTASGIGTSTAAGSAELDAAAPDDDAPAATGLSPPTSP